MICKINRRLSVLASLWFIRFSWFRLKRLSVGQPFVLSFAMHPPKEHIFNNHIFRYYLYVSRRIYVLCQTDFTLCLDAKSKQKSQGCARFPRKSYVLPAKIPELPDFHRDRQSYLLKQQEFFNAFNTCFSVHRTRPTSD